MKPCWSTLSKKIAEMVETKKNKERITMYSRAHLHAEIYRFFKNGSCETMNDVLKMTLTFYCKDLVALQKKDFVTFRRVNGLLTTLFHGPRTIKSGFDILKKRICELRTIEKTRNKLLFRNFLLSHHHRGICGNGILGNVYFLPRELFKHMFQFL